VLKHLKNKGAAAEAAAAQWRNEEESDSDSEGAAARPSPRQRGAAEEEEEEDDSSEDEIGKIVCETCKKDSDDDNMLLCDGCDRGYHLYCLRPKLEGIPKGEWYCPVCRPRGGRAVRKRAAAVRRHPLL
jgi:hypothetical protein